MDKDELYSESLSGTIGTIVRGGQNKSKLLKIWGFTNPPALEYANAKVSDKDFEEIKECFHKMKTVKSYGEYKKYYDKLCNKLGIRATKIKSYTLKKGQTDKNYVYVNYRKPTKEVQIPNGCSLYHISPCSKIKELNPTFRGKPPRCYFYSSPRVYLTIKKNMLKSVAQFRGKERNTEVSKYKVVENITSAMLDDSAGGLHTGAVYVETRFPIKVEKIDPASKEDKK